MRRKLLNNIYKRKLISYTCRIDLLAVINKIMRLSGLETSVKWATQQLFQDFQVERPTTSCLQNNTYAGFVAGYVTNLSHS